MRLTKEQFEELHPEFINFLATQAIDKMEWEKIKREQPEVAEQELDVFSDLIWEGVLQKTEYLEHFSNHSLFLFYCDIEKIKIIAIRITASDVDLLTEKGLKWLEENLLTEQVEIQIGEKDFGKDRNQALFEVVKQGAMLSNGILYDQINQMINS